MFSTFSRRWLLNLRALAALTSTWKYVLEWTALGSGFVRVLGCGWAIYAAEVEAGAEEEGDVEEADVFG